MALFVVFVFMAVFEYGALGAAVAWFGLQLIAFIYWPAFIHNKFAPGLHADWLLKDIFPVFISSVIVLLVLYTLVDIHNAGRLTIFLSLTFCGIGILTLNAFVSTYMREIIVTYIKRVRG